jgi:hypothetical protein
LTTITVLSGFVIGFLFAAWLFLRDETRAADAWQDRYFAECNSHDATRRDFDMVLAMVESASMQTEPAQVDEEQREPVRVGESLLARFCMN